MCKSVTNLLDIRMFTRFRCAVKCCEHVLVCKTGLVGFGRLVVITHDISTTKLCLVQPGFYIVLPTELG